MMPEHRSADRRPSGISSRGASRISVAVSLVVIGVSGLGLLSSRAESAATSAADAEAGAAAAAAVQQSNFRGGSPEVLDLDGLRTLRLRFPAGSRSNWHSHTGEGQLLMVEEGRGLHQVRGGSIEVMGPGQPWYTEEGVEHWHGAHPDEDVVQLTIYAGEVNWMDPVTDDQYRAPGR